MRQKNNHIWSDKAKLLAKELHNELSLDNYNWHQYRGNKERRSAELLISAISQLINDGDELMNEDLYSRRVRGLPGAGRDMTPRRGSSRLSFIET